LGFLNSKFFREYYLSNGGRRGGRVAFTQRILEETRIPLFSADEKEKIGNITKDIIDKLRKCENTEKEESKIEQIIYESIKYQKFESTLLF
jgi:adenine-specific DNA-methyltransferase